MKSKITQRKQALSRPKEITVFLDATDFWHEVGEVAGGSNIYGSIEEVLEYSPCSKECGTIEATLKYKRNTTPTDYSKGMSISEWEDYRRSEKFLKHLTEKLNKSKELVNHYKKKIKEFKESNK